MNLQFSSKLISQHSICSPCRRHVHPLLHRHWIIPVVADRLTPIVMITSPSGTLPSDSRFRTQRRCTWGRRHPTCTTRICRDRWEGLLREEPEGVKVRLDNLGGGGCRSKREEAAGVRGREEEVEAEDLEGRSQIWRRDKEVEAMGQKGEAADGGGGGSGGGREMEVEATSQEVEEVADLKGKRIWRRKGVEVEAAG